MDHSLEVRKGRVALFFIQIFATLGFSVLYSTLVLYTTEALHLDDAYATAFTAGFIAFNFSLHLLGGYIGGRFLSYRALFVVGTILQGTGCLTLSAGTLWTLLWGTAIFLSGSGLNVICVNCMLTQLFSPSDKHRESAFLWNYSGMNLGFFIGFTLSGFFQLSQNFRTLFLFSAIGSLVALSLTLLNWKYLRDRGTKYSQSQDRLRRAVIAGAVIVGLIIALTFLLGNARFSNALVCLVGLGVALLFVYFAWKEPAQQESRKIWAYLILAVGSLIFWTLYQMAPMGLTLFFERNVKGQFLGYTIPPQWLQNINTFLIVVGGPLMAACNERLRKRGVKISIPFQFTLSLFLIGFGFLLLPLGIFYADPMGYSAIGWVMGSYFSQSLGELFISPIGYAMIGQLIPSRLQGLAMGAWLMVTGVAATLSNYFSQLALGSSGGKDPLITNSSYSAAFLKLAICSLIGGVILFFLRSFLHKLIHEKETPS